MAHINIERKTGGAGWIWWLVVLIILALLVWWRLPTRGPARDAAADSAVPTAVPAAVTTAADAGVVTDLAMLTDTASAGLVGRQVALTAAPVLSAVSDKGFWAGPGAGPAQSVFVVRGNQNASYTAPDGAVDAGKRVNVWGRILAMPSDRNGQAATWNMQATDKSRLATQKIYVQADSVRIAGR